MEKSIFEQLDEIYDEEQLKKAIDNLPIHGRWDPKRKCIVVDGPPPEDADEWDKIYEETHPDERV